MRQRAIKTWTGRTLAGLLLLLVPALLAAWWYVQGSLAQLDGTRTASGLSAPVSVTRDERGVPLISGAARADLAYASGFVHAQERYFQMDLLRRVGGGELAELFGARALPLDRARRLHRFRARAELALSQMEAHERAFLERYVSGVNDGLNALRTHPFEYALIGVKPRPWTSADSLLVVCAMYFDLQGKLPARELARGWLREHSSDAQRAFLLPDASRWDAPLDAAGIALTEAEIPAAAPSWWGQPRATTIATTASATGPAQLASADFVDSVGSNNWAVSGTRTAHGAAIVADDMHLGTQLPNIWYRLALQYPNPDGSTRRVVGVTLPGALPAVVVGSNGHVAWGYTNSYGDHLDLIAVDSAPDKPGQLRTPAGWETPASHVETILVKGAAAERMVVRETSLGPVQQFGQRSYAIAWIAHQPGVLNLNPLKLERVNTLAEALDVAATVGIPAQNLIAGDSSGNIGWTIAGPLPRRAQGGPDPSYPLPLAPDGASFDGTLAPAEYPRLVNPGSGQLSSANSRQLAGPGAALIGDGGFDLGARHRQVRDGLAALGPETDVAGVYGVALDDRAIFMSGWRERAMRVLDAQALEGQPRRAEFLAQLKNSWTGHASVDSSGYRLARQFMWSLYDVLFDGLNGHLAELEPQASMALASSRWPAVLARLLDEQPAAWVPAGHADWRAVQLAAVDKAIASLTGDGGTLAEATWGARNTASIAHPISAAVPMLMPWLAAPADQLPGDANMPRVAGGKFGQSERMTVAPGREAEGVFNMPGGQSGHPLSPFFLAGHADWVAGRPSPLLPGPARHSLTFVPPPAHAVTLK